MVKRYNHSAFVQFFLILIIATAANATTVHEVVESYDRPGYLPSASDVSIRSLNFRPMNADDDQNTFDAIRDFHATRLEWVYLRFNEHEKELIRKVKDMGCVFGASGEPATGVDVELAAGREYIANSLLDLRMKPLFMEHSKDWIQPIYPGCMNNPVYLRNNLDYYVKNVQYGAEVLQRDSSAIQYHFASVGRGCFCPYCMNGFREYLKTQLNASQLNAYHISDLSKFNYRQWLYDNNMVKNDRAVYESNPLFSLFTDYQAKVTSRFFTNLRTAINIHALKRITFSHNNASHQRWELPHDLVFDFAISELVMNYANPAHIYDRACTARRFGKLQIFGTPKSMGKQYSQTELNPLKRQVIATAYASGGLARVPWDMFEDTRDGAGRYFGKPEHFADLFGFVRSITEYLDGYEDAGGFGPDIEENRYDQVPVKLGSGEDQIYAFLRAIPGHEDAPIVIHLVDWSERPSDFELSLRNESFFPAGGLKVSMLRPVGYNKSLHQKAYQKAQQMLKDGEKLSAKQAGAYSVLSEKVDLGTSSSNEYTKIQIPGIDPWAILVVTTEP